jgi:hypothetical protein
VRVRIKTFRIKNFFSFTTKSIKIKNTLLNSYRPWKKTLYKRKKRIKKKRSLKINKRIERRHKVSLKAILTLSNIGKCFKSDKS